MFVFKTKRHEPAVTNVLFCCRHSGPIGRATFLFLTRILAITITMWIAFRDYSHGVMPCIVVIISLLPRERVHNAFYPRRATKAVSRSIRKKPCCQQSAGCSEEQLKNTRDFLCTCILQRHTLNIACNFLIFNYWAST